MRKCLAFVLTLIMLLALAAPLAAAAEDKNPLPFTLPAPEHVSVSWAEGNDSPTTCMFSYSIPTIVSQFQEALDNAEDKDAFFAQYGLTDGWFSIQIDWALDDVNDPVSGWHYNKYWDGDSEYGIGRDDNGGYHYGEWDYVECGIGNVTETINDVWIFRGIPNDERLNGDPESGWIGVKDQLNPDQFTYDYENEDLIIDFTKHTVFVRARFIFTARDSERDRYFFSDWSEVASCGKGVEAYTPLTGKDIAAPEITDLHMTDKEFNDNPVVAFTLTVPDTLAKQAVDAEAHRGYIVIETYARVKGDTEWVAMGNVDWEVKPGEMECALLSLISDEHKKIEKDTPIELRCRYRCSQPEVDDVYSEYSKILTFETSQIGGDPTPTPTDTPVIDDPTPTPTATPAPEEKKDDKCPLCHFCPQPLGLCIFIWLIIIIVILLVVFIVVKKLKNDDNRKK